MNRYEISNRARALKTALEESGIHPHAVLPGRTEGNHQALFVLMHKRPDVPILPTRLSGGLECRVVYYEDAPKVKYSRPAKPLRPGKARREERRLRRTAHIVDDL